MYVILIIRNSREKNGNGGFQEMYNLVVNTNSNLASEILKNEDAAQKNAKISDALDLAKLSQNLLKGKELTEFIKRSYEKLAM